MTNLLDTLRSLSTPDTAVCALQTAADAAAAASSDAAPQWKDVLERCGVQKSASPADVEHALAEAAVIAQVEVALVFAQYAATSDGQALELPAGAFVLLQSLSTYYNASLEAEAVNTGEPLHVAVGHLNAVSDICRVGVTPGLINRISASVRWWILLPALFIQVRLFSPCHLVRRLVLKRSRATDIVLRV